MVHPDILKRLRRLAVFLVAVLLLVLAFAGLQDCRGGRAILAAHGAFDFEAKIELVSSGKRVVIWDGPLGLGPIRVSFPTNIGDAHFVTTVTKAATGAVATYENGYVSHSGGTYYFFIGETDLYFTSVFMGYYEDKDYPSWVNEVLGIYLALSDEATCLV